jgi:hypothetical protein
VVPVKEQELDSLAQAWPYEGKKVEFPFMEKDKVSWK